MVLQALMDALVDHDLKERYARIDRAAESAYFVVRPQRSVQLVGQSSVFLQSPAYRVSDGPI
ncbi:hypothetical protein D3C86_1782570 [compost metagenome]